MRRTGLRRRPRRTLPSVQAAIEWKRRRVYRCAVCNRQAHHRHHIIYVQHLLRLAPDHGRPIEEVLWDLRNMLPLCESCHSRHHSAFSRIPRHLLPDEALEFAAELELGWFIVREYPA